MKIGVIGGGTVGKAVARTYLEWADEVRVWDKVRERSTCNKMYEALVLKDVVFVCLPEDKLDQFFGDVGHALHDTLLVNYVLRSTVPVGTTRQLREKYGLTNLVHSPEFLTARCAETDARVPAVNVVGVPEKQDYRVKGYGREHPTQTVVGELYTNRFPGTPVIHMYSDESETLKLALNSFFAVKVSFFNELYQFCKVVGADFETIRAGMLADGRITAHHTRVPGPDSKFGFGGACLPKDLDAWIAGYIGTTSHFPVVAMSAAQRNPDDRK